MLYKPFPKRELFAQGSSSKRTIRLAVIVLIALTSLAGAQSVEGQGGAAEKAKPSAQPKKPSPSKTVGTNNVKRTTSVKSEASSRSGVAGVPGSPTLGETLEWLRNNVAPYYYETHGEASSDGKSKEYDLEVSWSPVRFTGCTLQWKEVLDDRQSSFPYHETRTITVQVSDLDPSRIKLIDFTINKITFYGVGLETTNGKKTINNHIDRREINGNKPMSNEDMKTAATGFIFRSEENAQRGLKALENAVKLCGGKVSSF